MKKVLKSKVTLVGSDKDGYVITVSDNEGFKGDIAMTGEEVTKLLNLIHKRLVRKK